MARGDFERRNLARRAMTPRGRKLLFDTMLAAALILAVGMARAAYTRATGGKPTHWSTAVHVAPAPQPHIACAFAVAEQCRKLEWWPE